MDPLGSDDDKRMAHWIKNTIPTREIEEVGLAAMVLEANRVKEQFLTFFLQSSTVPTP